MAVAARTESHAPGFRLEAWAGWLPGRDRLASGGTVAAGADLPSSLRRRVTPIGRQALDAAWYLLAGTHGTTPKIVLSSRHGEYSRTFGLLSSLAASGEVSPAGFSLSVHHALAGLLSIAADNRAGHTAVAAGGESFGYGCLEAATSLAEGIDRVLLLHFDEALPESYAEIGGGAEDSLALALLLAPNRDDGVGERIALGLAPSDPPGTDSLAHCVATLLEGGGSETRAAGERLTWTWQHVA
ncbi:beta-ketoacyl synthase chain length factor [Magnetospirillum fulvum]|uniref:Beta-ketoacyl synthase, N-terminal domain n=1 Tax=Magnetospirillum fulvum TaxID=1082 RepID=A0A1H6IMI5_MAGFU|nr:beta-ketoacyl synthase chain length factor [Magnetospirillum fulvum]SEH49882.1 Beta-ketoacyl synthase, N-terminal domain [Magnetospirillum fulvum]